MMAVCRSPAEIDRIDRACRVVRTILKELEQMGEPGVTTQALDEHAEKRCRELGGRPAFLGYNGYPRSLCVSINEQVIHGIPGSRELKAGDLVSVDFGVLLDGYYGDSAVTFPVGQPTDADERLSRVTRECLLRGIEQVRPGARIHDIGHAVESHAKDAGYGVVREFVGHAIGTKLHEEPQVPNYGPPGKGPAIREGMCLAIEPMITGGSGAVKVLDDGWTAVTSDGTQSAHWELVVAATDDGPRVLGDPA